MHGWRVSRVLTTRIYEKKHSARAARSAAFLSRVSPVLLFCGWRLMRAFGLSSAWLGSCGALGFFVPSLFSVCGLVVRLASPLASPLLLFSVCCCWVAGGGGGC